MAGKCGNICTSVSGFILNGNRNCERERLHFLLRLLNASSTVDWDVFAYSISSGKKDFGAHDSQKLNINI